MPRSSRRSTRRSTRSAARRSTRRSARRSSRKSARRSSRKAARRSSRKARRGKKALSPWIKHVMAYHQANPQISYKHAMKQAKHTYKSGGVKPKMS